jgi:hypothetical protein
MTIIGVIEIGTHSFFTSQQSKSKNAWAISFNNYKQSGKPLKLVEAVEKAVCDWADADGSDDNDLEMTLYGISSGI